MSRFHDARQLVDHALASEGESWPEAEAELLAATAHGVALEAAMTHPDPVGRQMAQTAATSDADARDALERATAYLEDAAQFFARTPARTPPIGPVAANLSATFGAALVGPLSLRLAQQRDQPHWRVMSTLLYLDSHRDPLIVPSLVRFAAQSSVPAQQELAVRLLGSIGGPSVASSVRDERDRLARTGGTLPRGLAALAG